MIRLLKHALTGAIPAFVIAACIAPREMLVPIPSKFYDTDSDDDQTLVIFLPGRGDNIDSFERAGFIDILRSSDQPLDSVVVDSHLGYYISRSIAERIKVDIMQPYEEQGYRRFVIVGVSLGGVGALRLNNDFPRQIVGIVLFAPFLGSKATIQSVKSAGGVRAWSEQIHRPMEPDEEIWTWINSLYDEESGTVPCTIIAYGRSDEFAPAGNYLAELLPESHVFTNGGGHKWAAWGPLWSEIVQSKAWKDLGCDA